MANAGIDEMGSCLTEFLCEGHRITEGDLQRAEITSQL
jgi:hypothetical protein